VADYIWALWLVLAVGCMIVEALTPSLISIWFGVGALLAAVASAFVDNAWVQIGVFLLGSALSLLVAKKFIKKPESSPLKEEDQRMIGRTGVAQTAINEWEGSVRLGDVYWRAVSDSPIEEGARVQVTAVDGTTVRVIMIEEKETVSV